MTNPKFIFGGASITDSPWLTWKDFVIERYQIKNYEVSAFRGVGNEFITWSVLNKINKHSLVCIMFTSVDKWDWMVGDPDIANQINNKEKHKVIDLDGNITTEGFWCTGSWFPVHKEQYFQRYFSRTYFLAKTLEKILLLQKTFEKDRIPYLFLFDSPILDFTEQDLNNCRETGSLTDLRFNHYINFWYQQIDWTNIYQPGLIGYCKENNLQWQGKKVGPHPPSSSHLHFCQNKIFPILDRYVDPVVDDFTLQVKTWDKLWSKL